MPGAPTVWADVTLKGIKNGLGGGGGGLKLDPPTHHLFPPRVSTCGPCGPVTRWKGASNLSYH